MSLLLDHLRLALKLYARAEEFRDLAIESKAHAEFENLLCPPLSPGEFSQDEWDALVAENDDLWALLKDDKSRARNAYQIGLLNYAVKLVEARR
jgi:hypothetical protein